MAHPADTVDAGPSSNTGGHHTQPNASQHLASGGGSVVDGVRDFFQYSPPILVKHENHITSDGTRKPADFDRHLASDLQLRRVVYLPSMTSDLAKIAEDALESAHLAGTLPPLADGFPTAAIRKVAFAKSGKTRIICEKQIEEIYDKTMAAHCCAVASTLEFGLPTWNPGHLSFTLHSETNHAKADGFFKLSETVVDTTDVPIPPLSDFDQSLAKDFPILSIWEFKSLVAAELPVMEAIFNQTHTRTFKWEGCEFKQRCSARHKTNTGLPKETGSPMGFDAKDPLCKLPTKLSRRSQPKDKESTKAKHITQQTWAEAVINDATYVVINAGNYEIIGIRHRKKQTLYLSDIIHVSSPGYGQLHTGLYLAIIRDARDRFSQLKETVPETWTRVFGTLTTSVLEPKDVMRQVATRDWLVMNPTNKAFELLPFIPNSHYIRTPPFRPVVNPTPLDLALLFRINVSEQVTHSIVTGTVEVDGVVLKKNTRDGHPGAVVLKCANNNDTIAILRNEYQVYLRLREGGVKDVPKVIGYYEHANVSKKDKSLSCSVLVMEHIGVPVNLESTELFSAELRQQFLSALKRVHATGYKHGHITKDHLMVRHEHLGGGVGLISFGTATPADPIEQAMEYLALASLLPNPLKHKREEDGIAQYSDFVLIPGVDSPRKIRRLGTW